MDKPQFNDHERKKVAQLLSEIKAITDQVSSRSGVDNIGIPGRAYGTGPQIPTPGPMMHLPEEGMKVESILAPKLIKPSEQQIGEDEIYWKWEMPEGCGISLTANVNKNGLEYRVSIVNIFDKSSITGNDTIVIGKAIESAGRWENEWRKYVGELMFPAGNNEKTPLQPDFGD